MEDLPNQFLAFAGETDLILNLLGIVFSRAKLGEVMNHSELDHGEDDEEVGDEEEDVQGGWVGNLRKVFPRLQAKKGHGQDCGDS